MITQYRPVQWAAGEPLTSAKLSAMAANDQYLFESLPRMQFNNGGVRKTNGIKILAVTAPIATTTDRHGRTTIYFGDFFSIGCRPVITYSINATPKEQFHLAIKGIGTKIPDHRGVEILASAAELSSKHNQINYPVNAHIIAVGF